MPLLLIYLHTTCLPTIMWKKIVTILGLRRVSIILQITVDKPKYLPKPHLLLYASRSSRSGIMVESKITGEAENPHCKEFQQLLANKELKSSLITFLINEQVPIFCYATNISNGDNF